MVEYDNKIQSESPIAPQVFRMILLCLTHLYVLDRYVLDTYLLLYLKLYLKYCVFI